jgi:transposase InsO family protein
VQELRQKYPVTSLLTVAGLASSTFYYQRKAQQAVDKYAQLKNLIRDVFQHHGGNYGYRRVADEIRHKHGLVVNYKTMRRLMGEMGLRSEQRPKKYNSFKGEVGATAPNVMNRKFHSERPNEKLVTDITEFKVGGEKLYLSPVLDLFNGEIIAFEMNKRPVFEMVSSMIRKLFARLAPQDKPILHSDQGWHYRMKQYRKQLEDRGVVQSMSRKGNCHDNAVMESFFGVLKSEMFHRKKFNNIDQLRVAITSFIDYYNYERIKSRLKGLSPVEYRTQHATS